MEKKLNDDLAHHNFQSKSDGRPLKLDSQRLERLFRRYRDNQNFVLGLIGGLLGASLGAVIWAIVTYYSNYKIGYMALLVGFLAGMGVRYFGKGIDKIYGVLGAALALFGCLAGNFLASLAFAANYANASFFDVFPYLTPSAVKDIMFETFQPMDLLFYGLAIYEGFRFSLFTIPQKELAKAVTVE